MANVINSKSTAISFVGTSFPTPIRSFPTTLQHARPLRDTKAASKRKRSSIVVCKAEGSNDEAEREVAKLEGELREMYQNALNEQIRDSGDEVLRDSDRRVLEGIAEVGLSDLEGIAGDFRQELQDVEAASQEYASSVIEEATESLLEKYDVKKQELLRNVDRDRDVIKGEMEKIEELAKTMKSSGSSVSGLSARGKALFLFMSMFGLGALIYGWTGFVDGNTSATQNAAIDATFAAVAAFFYSRETNS